MLAYKIVEVRRSELCTIRRNCAEWELPVLQAVHAEVTVIGDTFINREPPPAEDEYIRLTTMYKDSVDPGGNKGPPFVAMVYGTHQAGLKALRAAIEAATIPDVSLDDLVGDISAGG